MGCEISQIAVARAQSIKRPTQSSWRMDETYISVHGKWMYLYRAVDKAGNTLDFMLSARRNRPAATRFFSKALSSNGNSNKIFIDKSGATAAGIREVTRMLKRFGCSANECTAEPTIPAPAEPLWTPVFLRFSRQQSVSVVYSRLRRSLPHQPYRSF